MNSMIADEDEKSVIEVIRSTRITDELSDAIVGIEKVVELRQFVARRNKRIRRQRCNPTAGIFPRRVERNRKQSREEWLSNGVQETKLLIGSAKKVLIGNTPRTLENGIGEILFFDKSVKAVGHEKRSHMIKNALTSVEKERRIAALFENAGEVGKALPRLRPLDGAGSRQRWKRANGRLQTLNRSLSGRIAALQQHRFAGKLVQLWRKCRHTAETTGQARRKTFHNHEHNVERSAARAICHQTQQWVDAVIGKRTQLAEKFFRALQCLLARWQVDHRFERGKFILD